MKDEREQIADQCKAVAHMAQALADVYSAKEHILREGYQRTVGIVGPESAALMETLGNVLNGMDAVTEDDAWLDPIFKEAQKRYLPE